MAKIKLQTTENMAEIFGDFLISRKTSRSFFLLGVSQTLITLRGNGCAPAALLNIFFHRGASASNPLVAGKTGIYRLILYQVDQNLTQLWLDR